MPGLKLDRIYSEQASLMDPGPRPNSNFPRLLLVWELVRNNFIRLIHIHVWGQLWIFADNNEYQVLLAHCISIQLYYIHMISN